MTISSSERTGDAGRTARSIFAEFFKDAHGRVRLHGLTVIEDVTHRDGKTYVSRKEYDVEWHRTGGYYLFHQSGAGGGNNRIDARGIFFCSGGVKTRKKPCQWVYSGDKQPWKHPRTTAIRERNKTRQLKRLPRSFDLEQGEDILNWLERTGADVEPVYCSSCRDFVRGDDLCRHSWWCEKIGWYSTPSERCQCASRAVCDGDEPSAALSAKDGR